MRAFTLALCLLAATSCSTESPVRPSPIDQRVVLAPGQSAAVAGAGLAVLFEKVTGDSRCPADAMCILGGDAVVRMVVTSNGGTALTHELHTGSMLPARHGDVTIALVGLAPYPFSAHPIPPDVYRATLHFTR